MALTFSNRTAWDLEEGPLAAAVRQAREAGDALVDLTLSNPTMCGFTYDPDLLAQLGNPAALIYDPDPRGILTARQAVAGYYAERGANLDPAQLLLTTSTSEAYSYLFRLLCNVGDEVLVAQPSYPLLDFLARIDDVRLVPYPLFYDFGWWIDFATLERRITPRTRAILLVHPNNPTGHATSAGERRQLEELCVRHGLALIVDEVFLDYSLAGPVSSFATGLHPCLTFIVSGLSKIAALPQMKVGWLAGFGPELLLKEALARLEVVADTFLSLNAPVQLALAGWLQSAQSVRAQILARVRENLATLARFAHLRALPVEAGWAAIVSVPQRIASGDLAGDVLAGDELAERIVREAGVIVHPGSFYGMAEEHRIVISLLSRPEEFGRGAQKLNAWFEARM